jgi:hypothetical protein
VDVHADLRRVGAQPRRDQSRPDQSAAHTKVALNSRLPGKTGIMERCSRFRFPVLGKEKKKKKGGTNYIRGSVETARASKGVASASSRHTSAIVCGLFFDLSFFRKTEVPLYG